MYTSTSATTLRNSSQLTLQAVTLLSQRKDYATCHIHIPGESQRMPAVAVNGRFYSFFRSLKDSQKTLGLLLKLSNRGNQVVATPTSRGHALWVYEADATLASNGKARRRPLPTAAAPADCWIVSDRQPGYRICSLMLPDLAKPVQGITNGQKLYSLYRREQSSEAAIKLATRLCQRGDEVVIVVGTSGYVICIYEAAATVLS
ncbi:MAG: hypothetical protein AAGH78_08010 [Cyanobacteria bacterium P01_H01_bin.58]